MKDYEGLTDEALVALYHQGDTDAMEYLCKKYRQLVTNQGRHFFLKGGEPQDVIQEGMIGLFKAIQEYDEKSQVPFAAFAKLCVTRQILKAIEAADRLKNHPLNSYYSLSLPDDESDLYEVANLWLDSKNPEQLFIDSQEISEKLTLIREGLSPMERNVFEYMIDGLDYRTIAWRMGKSEKSIDNATQRIRAKVRKILGT